MLLCKRAPAHVVLTSQNSDCTQSPKGGAEQDKPTYTYQDEASQHTNAHGNRLVQVLIKAHHQRTVHEHYLWRA